ncbi:MAG TPA: ATP-binding protein, partial [Tissierellia bacterium]|nr:ATP-binding protein [Tissierellia bacterium]
MSSLKILDDVKVWENTKPVEDLNNIEVKIEKKDKVHILIKDNGKGIKEEDLKNIFERYYRGTNTGTKHKGSGLGM